MKPNTGMVIIVVSILIAIVAIFYIWSSHHRYYLVSSGSGYAYQIDRKTGEVYFVRPNEKVPIPNKKTTRLRLDQ